MDSFYKADIYANYTPLYSSEDYESEPEHLQRRDSGFFDKFESAN